MIEINLKQLQDAEWFKQHELTDDQFEQLIENKFIRARFYHDALKEQDRKEKLT
jgi:hypothetical protein